MADELAEPQRILTTAIEQWNPVALCVLFSGGYDSMITGHIVHRLNTHGLPIQVWAIDTQLAADGWREYVTSVADRFGWNFQIYDNTAGFQAYLDVIRYHGQPYSRTGHTWAYQRLKERGFNKIHVMNQRSRHDKTLFCSGVRQSESLERKNAPEKNRVGHSNKIFASPIIHWSNEQCDWYRIENDLPDNPFYDTVRGSGDCQCNWGNFITYRMLQKYSPKLAAGNVALIDQISKDNHGYGWDGMGAGQTEMLEDFEGECKLTSPFLCEGCSRSKVRAPSHIIEHRALQLGLF